MDRLYGKTLLIGKAPGQSKLCIGVLAEGNPKVAMVSTPTPVPNSVSRCKPAEGVAHCKIVIDLSGNIVITNLKPANVTYVDGMEIVSKKITTSSSVSLGKDKYPLDLAIVFGTAIRLESGAKAGQASRQAPAQGPQKSYDITHLEKVWDDFRAKNKKLLENSKRVNLIRSGCGIFTMCAMPCIYFLGPIGYVLTAIGAIGNIYSFVGFKKDNTKEEQEKLVEELQEKYICPNPDCHKYLGNYSYKFVKKQYSMHCPYCKCEYTENK